MAIEVYGDSPLQEESQNKRTVTRRCPICDRGHSCFPTPADLDPILQDAPREVAIGTRITVAHETIGSWHGSKVRLRPGTTVTVKNLHTQNSGDIRVMVELDDGDVYWVGLAQLTRK